MSEVRYVDEIFLQDIKRTKETIRSSIAKTISENIQRMRKTPNRPKGMGYFDEIAHFFGRHVEAGRKVIAMLCNFAPVELIYAADAVPMRLCAGFYDTVPIADRLISDTCLCPLTKSTLGVKLLRLSPFSNLCDVVICPGTCDGKVKLGEVLEDVVKTWKMAVPHTKEEPRLKKLWLDEVVEIKKKIERLTKRKISREKLRYAIELVSLARRAFCRLLETRKVVPPPISGRDAMLVAQTFLYDDIKRWTRKVEELCGELEARVKQGIGICESETPRIMLAGSPIIWPNWKIPNIVEESGAVIVCDELCSGIRYLYDPVIVDEWTMDDMLSAVAERYLLPSTCPCFTPNDKRVDRLLQMIEEFKVDGVVYHVLHGCHLYNVEFISVKRALKRENVPVYMIESEYGKMDIGQIKTRIEAFIELIRGVG
ncbi:MAG: double-cubane-cluster-containing anaerobic reductase [Candidatus Hecatellaceae archaeon]|nr:MAG: 2-hydroxyacyl-CoA dehydratase [Candidatus Hecatellales archaeon]